MLFFFRIDLVAVLIAFQETPQPGCPPSSNLSDQSFHLIAPAALLVQRYTRRPHHSSSIRAVDAGGYIPIRIRVRPMHALFLRSSNCVYLVFIYLFSGNVYHIYIDPDLDPGPRPDDSAEGSAGSVSTYDPDSMFEQYQVSANAGGMFRRFPFQRAFHGTCISPTFGWLSHYLS